MKVSVHVEKDGETAVHELLDLDIRTVGEARRVLSVPKTHECLVNGKLSPDGLRILPYDNVVFLKKRN